MKIIISGGGTGGHVYPAIAIANALREKGVEEILFVGANGKLEMEKVPKAGYNIKGLNIVGFHRTRKWRNFLFPFKLLASLWNAKKIIDKFGPDVAVGVGGYASGPILKIAQLKNIPTVIQEQNSYPGVTNKILASKADKIMVSYPDMSQYFNADRIILTGNPVRKDLQDIDHLREQAFGFFDFDLNKKTILIFGGSLGARSINKAVLHQADLIRSCIDVQFIWQVGKIYYEEYKQCALANCPHVKIMPFIDRMDLAYSVADVIVCRAGALTISELMLIGRPSVLVPSPNVAEDHQTKNAMALVNEDAALMIADRDADVQMMPTTLALLLDTMAQQKLSTNIKALAKPDARDTIADEIIKIANR